MNSKRPKTDEQILELIRDSMMEAEPRGRAQIAGLGMDSTLASLGIDSLAALEIGATIEDRLGIRMPDDRLARVGSIRDLVVLIRDNLDRAA